MQFTCNQVWEAMKTKADGRHCEVCNKTVHDFTNYSLAEIRNKIKQENKLCGLFTNEQVDTTFIAEAQVPKQVRFIALCSAFIAAIWSKSSFAAFKNIEATEQISAFASTPKDSLNRKIANVKPRAKTVKKSNITHNSSVKYKWYITRRFPFMKRVKIVPDNLRGRTMGAPRFL